MKKSLFLAAALQIVAASATASADVQSVVEARLGMKVDTVTKTDHLGLYEVVANGQIIYTDETASSFIVGNIIDGKTKENITGKRSIAILPFDLAVKQVRGNGKNTLVTFEDVNCGYCKRLAKDLTSLKDTTIYTFMIPMLGADSTEKTKGIWCAPDKAKAWNDWMVDGKAPPAAKNCNAPIAKLTELGQRMKVTGTPTLFFMNGDRVPGAVPLQQIEQRLAATAKQNLQ